jgi:cytoskeletal protein RodZ
LLTLVCLQVFVLLAAGFGLLISAQQRRAQVHNQDKPESTDTAVLEVSHDVDDFVDDDLAEVAPTIRAQSSIEDDLAPDVIVIRDASEFAAVTAPANLTVVASAADAAVLDEPNVALDQAVQAEQTPVAAAQTPTRVAPLPLANAGRATATSKTNSPAADVAKRQPPRSARVVNNARQPQTGESRQHRTAVRKRRWENSAERRSSARGETAPLQASHLQAAR